MCKLDDYFTCMEWGRTPNLFTRLRIKLFGTKCIGVDMSDSEYGSKVTVHFYKGKYYVTSVMKSTPLK